MIFSNHARHHFVLAYFHDFLSLFHVALCHFCVPHDHVTLPCANTEFLFLFLPVICSSDNALPDPCVVHVTGHVRCFAYPLTYLHVLTVGISLVFVCVTVVTHVFWHVHTFSLLPIVHSWKCVALLLCRDLLFTASE